MEIGKINLEKYRCIVEYIDTERVIITDEQLTHIKDHHSEAFVEIVSLFPSILDDPDFILKDNKRNNTVIAIKKIKEDRYALAVLKICIDTKGGEYCNSIISGWIISKIRLKNYLRSRKILYKRV